MEAVFLCASREEADFFTRPPFGGHPLVDLWQVDVTGLALEPGPDGWVVHRSPIPPDRIELAARDIPTSDPSTSGAGTRPSRTTASREVLER
jgi:hypothetical protein